MTTEVTNGAEETKTGQSSAADQENKQDAAATAPVQAAAKPPEQETTQEAAATQAAVEQPKEAAVPEAPKPPRTVMKPAETPSATEEPPKPPRTVPKPAEMPAPPESAELSGDIDFGAILEQFEQDQTVFHSGELVEGKVVGVSDRGVLVDFGYKSEGIIPAEEFPEG